MKRRPFRARRCLWHQRVAQVGEMVEVSGEEPGAKPLLGAGDPFAVALPDERPAAPIGPDRDDSRGRVPAKQPCVVCRRRR